MTMLLHKYSVHIETQIQRGCSSIWPPDTLQFYECVCHGVALHALNESMLISINTVVMVIVYNIVM